MPKVLVVPAPKVLSAPKVFVVPKGIAEEDNGQVLASRFLMPCVTRRPYCRAQRRMSWLGVEGRWKSKVPSLERCGGQLDRASVSLDNASLIIDFASLSIALVRCALYKVVLRLAAHVTGLRVYKEVRGSSRKGSLSSPSFPPFFHT